ncbi:MAG TPA: hypothetical protein VJH97_06625 [Candidatus Nanoarchaeia archaeon]|nr:hypothetical protein [Candidatus Nanoarchaeia archaeon]
MKFSLHRVLNSDTEFLNALECRLGEDTSKPSELLHFLVDQLLGLYQGLNPTRELIDPDAELPDVNILPAYKPHTMGRWRVELASGEDLGSVTIKYWWNPERQKTSGRRRMPESVSDPNVVYPTVGSFGYSGGGPPQLIPTETVPGKQAFTIWINTSSPDLGKDLITGLQLGRSYAINQYLEARKLEAQLRAQPECVR